MKTSQQLGLAAIGFFVISHCLPAYGDGIGFACFQECWRIFVKHEDGLGGWLYYSGFAFANILFPILVICLFVAKKSRHLRGFISLVLLLDVISWLVIQFFDGKSSAIHEIKIGYYVWLLAYVVLFTAHLTKEPNKSL